MGECLVIWRPRRVLLFLGRLLRGGGGQERVRDSIAAPIILRDLHVTL